MNLLSDNTRSKLQNAESRTLLIDAVRTRTDQLRELGRLDLDCQLLESEGRSRQAREVYRQVVILEEQLDLS